MEKHPKKHEKYPKDKCISCDRKYELTPENTRFNIYDYQQYCNHLYTTCTHCEDSSTILFTRETVEEIAQWGYPIKHDKYPPPHIIEAYNALYGLEPPETHKLSKHEKNLVRFTRFLLENEQITPEDFDGDSELFI